MPFSSADAFFGAFFHRTAYIGEDNHLYLPNGTSAAPRSVAYVYKQNLVTRKQPYAKSKLQNIYSSYKALGYREEPRQITEERRARKVENRERRKWQMKMGETGNGLMKHFRAQIPF